MATIFELIKGKKNVTSYTHKEETGFFDITTIHYSGWCSNSEIHFICDKYNIQPPSSKSGSPYNRYGVHFGRLMPNGCTTVSFEETKKVINKDRVNAEIKTKEFCIINMKKAMVEQNLDWLAIEIEKIEKQLLELKQYE